MNTTTTPASNAAATGKGKGNSKGTAAKGEPKAKGYVTIGTEGVAQVEALCAAVEQTIGFRPTQAQIVLRLVKQATEQAAKAKASDAAVEAQG